MPATEAPASVSPTPRVYVAVLNWNGWRDTVACLDSLLATRDVDYRVVVCDNGSTDGSLDYLRRWLNAESFAGVAGTEGLPMPAAPVDHQLLERADAAGPAAKAAPDRRVTLIDTGANLGYAGGNNVALTYALDRGDADYVWVLNNDVIVEAQALAALVARASADPRIGLCGSMLLDFDPPHRVQALGGARFNRWLGTHAALGAGTEAGEAIDPAAIEAAMDYVIGASMLVSRAWLERVGLLCEDYFLYFEEIDWAVRGRDRFRLAFASDSRVYHRNGASTGRPGHAAGADLLALRNRLRFTRNRLPWALPTVWLGFLPVLVNRARRRQFGRLPAIFGIMCGRGPNLPGGPGAGRGA